MEINKEQIDTFIRNIHGSELDSSFQYGVVELPNELDRVKQIQETIDKGRHAGMTFTFSKPEYSGASNKFEWANSAIVVAYNYMKKSSYQTISEPGNSRIAVFSTKDHYEPLRKEIDLIIESLIKNNYQAKSFVDSSFHYDRLFFEEAGLGWQGKSTMMLSPGVGPWQLLGTIFTSKEFIASNKTKQSCGDCNYCKIACPTGALNEDYILDANLCIAYWLQSPKIIPRDFRIAIGDRFYGCDECLISCPPGQREVRLKSQDGNINIVDFLQKKDEEILKDFERFYIPKLNASYLRRNALIALSNNPIYGAETTFVKYLSNSNPELAMYAVWCLWRISRLDVLYEYSHKIIGKNKIVQDEIDWALKMPS